MKFRKGNSVEVLRREHDPCGSWFPGSIVSVGVGDYVVRYKFLVDHKGEPVVEKVHREDVKPVPPHGKAKRWMVGDIAEVFDVHCWRVGKIAKVLKNNRFVIRLFGSIQLREFHESDLRIRQAWHNNNWSEIGKVAQNKQFAKAPIPVTGEDSCSRDEDGQGHLKDRHDHLKKCLPARTADRSHAYYFEPSSNDLLIGGSLKKRKSSHCAAGCDGPRRRTLPLFKQVDDIPSLQVRVNEKLIKGSTKMDSKMEKATTDWLDTCSWPLWSTEDSNQCSVASCSSNDFADCPGQHSRKSLDKISDSSDAESSFPLSGKNHLPPSPLRKLEAGIHKLELRAYKSTVQALYVSGPLSWEQESLLTNLRLSLHISDDEHLLQLRHLLSAQVL